MPAEAQFYFKMIRRVTAFDPINMDGLFDSVTGLESKPLSTNYEALGYESGYFVRNMGSLCLIIIVLPLAYFGVRGLLALCTCGSSEWQNKTHRWRFLIK